MAANHDHCFPSSSEKETSSSSAGESSSKEEHQINKQKSDSESDLESEEYESGAEDNVESGNIKPKSIVQVEGRRSEERNSEEEAETDDDVSENQVGGEDNVEYGDIKPNSIVQVEGRPSEERNSEEEEETDDDVSENQVWIVKAKPKSSKRNCPLLKEEIKKLNLYGLEKKIKYDEEAQALEEKLRKHKIRTMKQDLKRMNLNNELFGLMLEGYQKWLGSQDNGAGK